MHHIHIQNVDTYVSLDSEEEYKELCSLFNTRGSFKYKGPGKYHLVVSCEEIRILSKVRTIPFKYSELERLVVLSRTTYDKHTEAIKGAQHVMNFMRECRNANINPGPDKFDEYMDTHLPANWREDFDKYYEVRDFIAQLASTVIDK